MKVSNYKNEKVSIDEDLILFEEIGKGNKQAFERLYSKYYENLCRYSLTIEDDIYIVEEKVSDVFYYIWDQRARLNHVTKPKIYLFIITKNLLFKHLKTKNKYCKYNYSDVLYELDGATNIEDQMIINEDQLKLQAKLLKILEKIPIRSRQIFEMNRIDGLKYKQIAEILGLASKTVENHIAIAMRVIEKSLKKSK